MDPGNNKSPALGGGRAGRTDLLPLPLLFGVVMRVLRGELQPGPADDVAREAVREERPGVERPRGRHGADAREVRRHGGPWEGPRGWPPHETPQQGSI